MILDLHNLHLNFEGPLAVVTLDRPPVNALNEEILRELSQALDLIKARNDLRVVLLNSASPRAFVAGADILGFTRIPKEEVGRLIRLGQDLFDTIEAFPLPIIAAVNGPCLGGGCELVLACHMRIASERARFGQPEINLGIIPGWGGTQRLPRLIGKTRGLELLLTGEVIDGAEAYGLGLVNRIVAAEDLEQEARRMAERLARQAPLAIQAIIATVARGGTLPLSEGQALEARAFERVFASEDAGEGIRAFLDKRPPVFKNR
jgi:enoyl-CoA hydratase/carnithine racemase